MFKNKKEFVQQYTERMVEKYGRDPKDAHIYEKYDNLGELVRD